MIDRLSGWGALFSAVLLAASLSAPDLTADDVRSGLGFVEPKPIPPSDGAVKKVVIRHPKSVDPPPPVDPPTPAPKPDPTAAIRLNTGQFYVIGSNVELLPLVNAGLKLRDAGSVTITARKPPLVIPAEVAVGYKPDPTDPDVVTFKEPFLYIVKAKATGPVVIQLIPAFCESTTSADGKAVSQKALEFADITYLPIDVFAGKGPIPPPGPIPLPKPKPEPTPTPDVDPALVAKFKEAIDKDLAIKGTVATKQNVKDLAGVYSSTAKLIVFEDPAARPKTWKVVQQGMVTASRLAAVPPPPELTALRTAIESEAGSYDGATLIDDAFGKKLSDTFVRIAAAIEAAAK